MSAIAHLPQSAAANRRRSVRQKVHAPAYASFVGASKSEMLELYEVLDIGEGGVAIQCPSQIQTDRAVNLCLDLAESSQQLVTTARVIWSDPSGRAGLAFPALPAPALHGLQEWLFLNAMASVANATSFAAAGSPPAVAPAVRQNFSDMLSAASAVQREAESLGTNLEAVLSLMARRSQSLLRTSGAAIALAGDDADTMICRASAGPSAPPVGARLQVGSGFSGDCVRTGRLLRCNDTETHHLVDRESCRALGIRSLLAAPISTGENVVGLLEVFSAQPNVFGEGDSATLQRFAETIAGAVRRVAPQDEDNSSGLPGSPTQSFSPPGSILFASETADEADDTRLPQLEKEAAIHLPRGHLYLLYCTAATIALVLGFMLAPWIQQKLQARGRNDGQTVFASSRAPGEASQAALQTPGIEAANLEQLRDLARHGNAAAENALGLLYAQGDEKQAITQDERESVRWFTKAAEDGSVPAQYKLSLLYWGGHGVPKDANKAYFWAVLARAGGQDGSQDLAKILANGMRRAQATVIEQQAEIWYQQHESQAKPRPGR